MTMAFKDTFVAILYLISAIFFIIGIKRLAKPKTATQGNLTGAVGMAIAVVAAFIDFGVVISESGAIRLLSSYWYFILAALVLGSIVGVVSAVKVQMTGMPQMVAIFNGLGGGASFLVAGVYLAFEINLANALPVNVMIATGLSGLIGAVTLSGSLIAYAKLQGLKIIPDKPVSFKFDLVLKLVLLATLLGLSGYLVFEPTMLNIYWIIVFGGLILGILLVIGIGGADMPVVISLLNSYSGIAAAATGFVLNNLVLIIAGSLVGASGIILTMIMTKAMNRSLVNVLFGGFGGGGTSSSVGDEIYEGKIKSTSPDEVAMILESAQRVVIVPGYGMAVARAATPVRLLTEALEAHGVEVVFGIHPVAGRMPGHMNVLLAEESIPYEKLLDLDTVNPTFANTDVVIVIGANDVVNTLAREEGSAIAGMPILDVDQARTCVVIKRSLSSGFAGIPNPLFAEENTLMLFGDGKKAVEELVAAFKDL